MHRIVSIIFGMSFAIALGCHPTAAQEPGLYHFEQNGGVAYAVQEKPTYCMMVLAPGSGDPAFFYVLGRDVNYGELRTSSPMVAGSRGNIAIQFNTTEGISPPQLFSFIVQGNAFRAEGMRFSIMREMFAKSYDVNFRSEGEDLALQLNPAFASRAVEKMAECAAAKQ